MGKGRCFQNVFFCNLELMNCVSQSPITSLHDIVIKEVKTGRK